MGKPSVRVIAGSSVAALASVALFAVPASAHPVHHQGRPGHGHASWAPGAVFVQNDDVKGNTVIVYDRAADGSLTKAGSYATGGLGGRPLSSQGSLTYDKAHKRLYAVNARSNTLTVFAVRGDRLTREQVVSTGGSFPTSVTVHGGNVYVLNAKDGGSVQGYLNVLGHLVRVPSRHRSLGIEGDGTPGQVSFTPDGSKLVVAGKDNSTLSVYGVGLLGNISARPVETKLADGGSPYALAFDTKGRAVVADSAGNALDTFSLGRRGYLTKVDEAATNQSGTCWVVRDGNFFFAGNAGSGTISTLKQTRGKLTKITDTPSAEHSVDLAVSSNGKFLYAQSDAAGVVNAFKVQTDGSLTKVGSVAVPNGVGGEGIAAS